jgi:hypothetical protein
MLQGRSTWQRWTIRAVCGSIASIRLEALAPADSWPSSAIGG